jgi:non-specific serine/threonine protein kinase
MSLPSGTRLGPYEILRVLGAGGMGEVYRARDTKLGREVALKILPPAFIGDPDRLARFEQEAQLLASLNHPYIGAIYGMEESRGLRALVLELIEGPTLAETIGDRPLDTAQILAIGEQITDALMAAHDKGITHRDIKPANIVLSARGDVKVLDFGLAKIGAQDLLAAHTDPTRLLVTTPGLVMGTVAYMSPEQASGLHTDHRTDLFSLGVVLYLMTTGRLPFSGSTDVQTLDLIRHAEPEAMARFNYEVPAELVRIIRKCLEKEVDRRYQSARELLVDLRNLKRDSGPHAVQPEVEELRRHNLRETLTSFVGRDHELAEIERLLTSTRLLTLTGAGGCGKTRLALQVAAALLPRFTDGVWVVELAPLSEPSLVTLAVATVLGVREGSTRSLRDSVLEHLRHRHILLVLDNCEHLIDACAELAEALVRGASHLRILATSREGLGIAGETVWRVPSLSLPDPSRSLSPQALLEFEAARLFIERATAVDPSFAVGQNHAATIGEICHRLDGIPLAIELAAARVNVLSVEQITSRLNDRFRLLTGGSRSSVARHRTLEATVDWSYELLSETERRVLRALSVFPGGWSLEAAEEVCSGDAVAKDDVLDLLSHLVDKSLVVVEDDGAGGRRYRYLETVRQYGRDRLLRSGETEGARNRHLEFFFALALRAEPELRGRRQASWLRTLHLEYDNLRSALDWCMSSAESSEQRDRALDFATALWWFWVKRGFLAEGRRWLNRGVEMTPKLSPSRGAKAYSGLANLAYFQGDFASTTTYARNSVALGREAGDLSNVAFSLGIQTIAAAEAGDVGLAVRLSGECREAARASGDPWTAGPALYVLGYLAIREGDFDKASRIYEEGGEELVHEDPWASSIFLSCLVGLRVVQGRLAEANALGARCIALCQEIEDPVRTAWCLDAIAVAQAAQGGPLRSARLWGASDQLLDSAAALLPPTHRWIRDRHFDGVKEALGDAASQTAMSEGRSMSLRQAIRYALEVGPS